ncbi:PEP-CTERM sorting domain-containing protein [Desulfogranum japonicum]|uniref:PEP-CTERM sorting domain-containing protein n=1 Tax=Desulfogranum japonicum TaxID=231447 RepID=UPI000411973D|nr:PEP-CTERM sorting domain-containing protein [Desulfogranum japonicum]
MNKLLASLTATAAGCLFFSTGAQAASYTFEFNANDILYIEGVLFGNGGSTPTAADIYNGATRVVMGDTVYTTYTSGADTAAFQTNFYNEALANDYRLTSFNLWGLGDISGASASDWGEEYVVDGWDFSGSVGASGWYAFLYSDSGTLDETVPVYASLELSDGASYANGISYTYSESELAAFTFTITFDLDDSFDGWYLDQYGDLVFWIGGTFVDADGNLVASYQTNMLLTANGVPEPGSMMLFGAGMLGITAVIRRKK